MFPQMYKTTYEKRFEIVNYYLKNGATLKETAKRFNVHYQTVYKWVYRFKKEGSKGLLNNYRKPWNRIDERIEKKICALKEKNPSITVRKAKKILEKQGIKVSIKGIWNIWKRYGYAGFKKQNMTNEYIEYIKWTEESYEKYRIALKLFKENKIKECAEILNSIPALPRNEILPLIPDRYLNLRRRTEKIFYLFGRIPINDYLKKTTQLYRMLRKRRMNFSALRVGIKLVMALEYKGNMSKIIEISKDLKKIMGKGSYNLFEPRFSLLVSEGIAYSAFDIRKAKKIAARCSIMLKSKKNPSPYFMFDLGTLYKDVFEFKKAEYWLLRCVDRVDENTSGMIRRVLAHIYFMKGEYKKMLQYVKSAEFVDWEKRSMFFIYESFLSILKGNVYEAMEFLKSAFELLKKEDTVNIVQISLIISSLYSLLNERKKSIGVIRRLRSFLIKNKIMYYDRLLNVLINPEKKRFLNNRDSTPILRLLNLLTENKYGSAINYALKKWIKTYFYIFSFIRPDIVKSAFMRGERTPLPSQVLRFPVFSKENIVLRVNILGDLKVYKNQKYLKINLTPKEKAFLIYLAFKLNSPDKEIPVDEIINNFWPGAYENVIYVRKIKRPHRLVSRYLYRIRKELKLPVYFIKIYHRDRISFLVNKGIYFITDYFEFIETLSQAKFYLNKGNFEFYKREFLRAFKLFRGLPFEKMYDNFSDEMRNRVLRMFEIEFTAFLRQCLRNGRVKLREKILRRIKSKGIDKLINLEI